MKSMRSFSRLLAAAIATGLVALAGVSAHAEGMAGPSDSTIAALRQLFGNTAFTGTTEFRVLDSSLRDTMILPMTYSMLDGSTRFDVAVAQMKSAQIPAAYAMFYKQLGTLGAIIRPDKKLRIAIFPVLKAYTESPMDKDDEAYLLKNYKLSKTSLGRETVAGHACEKTKVILTDDSNHAQQALVWYATDLKDFPIQIQMSDTKQTFVVTFRQVKLGRPDPKLFEPPADMKRYDDAQMAKKLTAMAGQQ
jgi:hypothetical protein